MTFYNKTLIGILGCCIFGKINYGYPLPETDPNSLYSFCLVNNPSHVSDEQVSSDSLPDWIFASQQEYWIGISDPIADKETAKEQAIARAICSWGLARGEKINSIIQDNTANHTHITQGSWKLILKSFDYKLLKEFEYKTGEIFVAVQVKKTEDGDKRMLVENFWSDKISENAEMTEEHLNIAVYGFKKLKIIQFKLERLGDKIRMHSSIDGQGIELPSPVPYPESPCTAEQQIDPDNIIFTPKIRYTISKLSDYPLSFVWLKTALIEAPIEPLVYSIEGEEQFGEDGNDVFVTAQHQTDFHIPYIQTAARITDNRLFIKWEVNEELNEVLKKQVKSTYQ